MKSGRRYGSGLVEAACYMWDAYSRCVDRLESIFMQSSVMKLLKAATGILSANIKGSFIAGMSRPLDRNIYYGSVLLGCIKRPFCRAVSLVGMYYEGSGFRRIASGIETLLVQVDVFFSGSGWKALKDNSKMIGILRRCSGKK